MFDSYLQKCHDIFKHRTQFLCLEKEIEKGERNRELRREKCLYKEKSEERGGQKQREKDYKEEKGMEMLRKKER